MRHACGLALRLQQLTWRCEADCLHAQVSTDKAFLSKQAGGGREKSRAGPSMSFDDPGGSLMAAEQLSSLQA